MATKLLDRFKNQIGELALVPGSNGAFEIVVGEERLYSKLETGSFPSEGEMVAEVGERL